MQDVLTFYRQSFSSSQPSQDQAQRSHKKRSVCQDRKPHGHGNILIKLWQHYSLTPSICSPAEETMGVKAGAGGREDVQEGVDGGGWVTQVQNKIGKVLRGGKKMNGLSWVEKCRPLSLWSPLLQSF